MSKIKRIESKYCKCGEPVNISHNDKKSMWIRGKYKYMRFFHPGEKSKNLNQFRCDNCKEMIKYEELKELGQL